MLRFLIFLMIGIAVFVGPQVMQSGGRIGKRVQQLLKTGEFAEGSAKQDQAPWRTTSWQPTETAPAPEHDPHALPPELSAQLAADAAVERELLPLASFLRFDITPQWVTHHFERVTVLPTIGGQGLRVPLISGTRLQDLAGSLTYFFDRDHLVQRIALDAETGDPRAVTEFVTKHFKLKEVAAGVYVHQFNKIVISGMLVEHSRLIQRDQPQSAHMVRLELNRPGNYKQVSRPFHQRLMTASR